MSSTIDLIKHTEMNAYILYNILVFFSPKDFYIIKVSNLLTLSVPDGCYSRNVPDGCYSRNVPDGCYSRGVPDGCYSRNVPDGCYSRNVSCAVN